MATVHLISGLPCSGKTTYAEALKSDAGSVHFALDYWLITAFGRYSIESLGHEEHTRRVLACRDLIWKAASPLLARDVDVILDDGFFFRDHRMQRVRLAQQLGVEAKIHFLNTPADVLRARLQRRNDGLPKYNFHIEPAMLQVFLGLFEVPSPDEGAQLVVVNDAKPLSRGTTPS